MCLLPVRKARICRIAGAVFLMLAGVTAGPGRWLIGAAPTIYLDENGVRWRSEPLTLLDEEDDAIVAASFANERRFTAYVEEPHGRLMPAAITSLSAPPFVGLISGGGLAWRRLGSNTADPLAHALPWLRRASVEAFAIKDLTAVCSAMMLAIAACSTIWAVGTGLLTQRDLDDFV